jgi:hypothetical protein
MTVTVTPDSFTMVEFSAADIAAVGELLLADIGLPAGTDLVVEVDETTPLGRSRVTSLDPVTIQVESGALEDAKNPRNLSEPAAADVLGRLLFRVRDRLDPAFGDPPPDSDLSLAQSVAWDAYAVGRLARLGYRGQRQRRLYHFRNRHGFSDAADSAFEQLWTAEILTWAEIDALSSEALATSAA